MRPLNCPEGLKEACEAVAHYKRKILRSSDDNAVVLHCLKRLEKVPVNVQVLQETAVGKVVNNLRKSDDEEISSKAKAIVQKWRDVVEREEEEGGDEPEVEEQPDVDDLPEVDEEAVSASPTFTKPKEKSNHHRNESSSSSRDRSKLSERQKEKKRKSIDDDDGVDVDDGDDDVHRKQRSSHASKERSKSGESHDRDRKHKDSHSNGKSHSNGGHNNEGIKREKDRHSSKSSSSSNSGSHKSKKSSKHKSENGESLGFEEALMAASKEGRQSRKDLKPKSSSSQTPSSSKERPKKIESKGFHPPLPPELPPLFDVPFEISPNYVPQKRPLPTALPSRHNPSNGRLHDDSSLMSITRSTKRTAIYSGSKRSAFSGEVPTLFQICIHILQEHVDDIAECGGLPYDILEPILERAKPETLSTIEEYNPYLTEDTGILWERICRREFPREEREEFESWREVYDRCLVARQEKLDFLTVKVQQSYKKVQTTSRKAKLAYVDSVAKPPREVQRAQMRNGTAASSSSSTPATPTTPSIRETVRNMGGPPRPRGEGRMRGEGFQSAAKAKKPPMMMKTLKLMQGIKTNFRK